MKNKRYIALAKKDFILNEEVESYFEKMHIKIINYYENLNILQLESTYALNVNTLEYINYLELEKNFSLNNNK